MVRYEGCAAPENLRIRRVRGNSMEPEVSEGDRVVVDVSRWLPATGETFVLWDGIGLVVKRVKAVHCDAAHEDDPPRIRLMSANPDYAPYSCLVEDAHILGKVLWAVRRASRMEPLTLRLPWSIDVGVSLRIAKRSAKP